MPKILVTNLPVTTFVNAEIDCEDGPESTLHDRLLEAVRRGRWTRASGANAEDIEDLVLRPDLEALRYPLWSFEFPRPGAVVSPEKRALIDGHPEVVERILGNPRFKSKVALFEKHSHADRDDIVALLLAEEVQDVLDGHSVYPGLKV